MDDVIRIWLGKDPVAFLGEVACRIIIISLAIGIRAWTGGGEVKRHVSAW